MFDEWIEEDDKGVVSTEEEEEEVHHSSKLLCEVDLFCWILFVMHRFVRGLVSNVHLVRSHMSRPKFLSSVNSQTKMLGHISTISGHKCEGEGRQTTMGLCVVSMEGNPLNLYCC